jgi:hypothetical protein
MKTRILLGAVGVAAGLFGALRLLQTGWDNIVGAVVFLAGGVALHDGFLAPLTIAVTVLGTRLLPPTLRARVTLGLAVLLTVTLSALPAILRLGARPDNATLLPRNYLVGWVVFAVVVLVGTLLVDRVVHGRRRAKRVSSSSAG